MNKLFALVFFISLTTKGIIAQSNHDKWNNFKTYIDSLKLFYKANSPYANSNSGGSTSFELYTRSDHSEIKVNDTIEFYFSQYYCRTLFHSDSILAYWSFYRNHRIIFRGYFRGTAKGWSEGRYLKYSCLLHYKRQRPIFRLRHNKKGIYINIYYFDGKKEIYKLISDSYFLKDRSVNFIRIK
jgi:hypothetical protein